MMDDEESGLAVSAQLKIAVTLNYRSRRLHVWSLDDHDDDRDHDENFKLMYSVPFPTGLLRLRRTYKTRMAFMCCGSPKVAVVGFDGCNVHIADVVVARAFVSSAHGNITDDDNNNDDCPLHVAACVREGKETLAVSFLYKMAMYVYDDTESKWSLVHTRHTSDDTFPYAKITCAKFSADGRKLFWRASQSRQKGPGSDVFGIMSTVDWSMLGIFDSHNGPLVGQTDKLFVTNIFETDDDNEVVLAEWQWQAQTDMHMQTVSLQLACVKLEESPSRAVSKSMTTPLEINWVLDSDQLSPYLDCCAFMFTPSSSSGILKTVLMMKTSRVRTKATLRMFYSDDDSVPGCLLMYHRLPKATVRFQWMTAVFRARVCFSFQKKHKNH